MINLSDKNLGIVKQVLSKYLNDEIVWVFGSRVKGLARKFSDLDLAIESPSRDFLELNLLLKIKSDFSESDLPWEVDIVDYNSVDADFKAVIDSEK